MAGAPFASIRIAGRFRYRASTTTADGESSARRTAIVCANRRPSRPRSIRKPPAANAARDRPGAGTCARDREHPPDTPSAPSTATANVAPADTATSTSCGRTACRQRLRTASSAGRRPCRQARAAASGPRDNAGSPPKPPAPAVQSANSPLGLWLTEEKEGKVRIEQCGANLCGYSVDAKSNQNGEQVLINMKPGKDSKWTGRILDPEHRQHL